MKTSACKEFLNINTPILTPANESRNRGRPDFSPSEIRHQCDCIFCEYCITLENFVRFIHSPDQWNCATCHTLISRSFVLG